ncbi:hypothetical protein [Legionella sp. PL877]|nr:hypothetical protein [Legionella sp. PL877]MDI9819069.1 hypothetical protein [Legionella sp. PL877]
MTAVLQRLNYQMSCLPIDPYEVTSSWEFSEYLAKQQTTSFQPFIEAHALLALEYSILCSQLAHDFTDLAAKDTLTAERVEDCVKSLVTALLLAELLTHLYRYYLNVPREVCRLEKEQALYRLFLQNCGYQFPQTGKVIARTDAGSYTRKVRDVTAALNLPRQLAGRVRRLLITLVPVAKNFSYFCRFVAFIDPWAAPVLGYIAWVFYIPRFLVNVALFLKHILPGFGLAKEKELPLWIRVKTQLERRWFELGNDSLWLAGGLLNCFILTGTLAPVGLYLTVALFLFDAAWAGLRAFVELRRLSNLQAQYDEIQRTTGSVDNPSQMEGGIQYQAHLQQRIEFERKRLLLSVFNTAALFLAMCLAIPALAVNPIIPLIGAILLVAITFINYAAGKWVEKQRPSDKLPDLNEGRYSQLASRFGIFKPAEPLESAETTSSMTESPLVPMEPFCKEIDFNFPSVIPVNA